MNSCRLFLSTLFLILVSCKGEVKTNDKLNSFKEERVTINSNGWEIVGDFLFPSNNDSLPVVLMLNKAAGDRKVYAELSKILAKKGVASLRVDLRGHGESINLGKFIPGEVPRSPLIWDSELDVISLHKYLKSHPFIDSNRIAILGSSYSGEEMAEAGRVYEYAKTYVALSPGSFSGESIMGIDESEAPWLFVAGNDERYLQEITTEVYEKSKSVELLVVPGKKHASDLLIGNKGLTELIAVWIANNI